MDQKFVDLVEETRTQQYPYKIQPGASIAEVAELTQRALHELNGYAPPDFYLNFLRTTDGMAANGFKLYGSRTRKIVGFEERVGYEILGLVEANLIWREYEPNKRFVFLAETGDVLYCHNLTSNKFEIVDRIAKDMDNPETDAFDTCEALMEKLLNHMLDRYGPDDEEDA